MRPSIWEEDDSGKDSGADILAEERERRLQRRRGFRVLFPSNWLAGRTGVVILLAFLVGGLGWFGFQRWDDARQVGPGVGSPSLLPLVPERGQGPLGFGVFPGIPLWEAPLPGYWWSPGCSGGGYGAGPGADFL